MIAILQITGNCNLKCNFCLDEHKEIPEASLATWKEIILNHKEDRLYITGGEPAMYPQFEELMQFIREQGLRVRVNTNGLATEKILKNKDVIEEVIISLHTSSDKDANKFLGDSKQHNLVIESIKKLNEASLNVKVSTVVANTNKTKLKNISSIIEELKPNTWLLRQYVDTNNIEEMVIKNTEFFKFVDPVIELFIDSDITVRFIMTLAESSDYVQYKPDGEKEA